MHDLICVEWNQITDILAYLQFIEQTKACLEQWGINITDKKTKLIISWQIYKTNIFTEKYYWVWKKNQ